uniref:Uncharacterized protein n=1 Tax=Candidatus Kentrum sp. UNK TaxID=2126344 RepID=A0A451AQP0_9GAMM|nr:MAG: hypothetical protein BECKUNK1418G_GA0071005_100274 [Candidatus Kentron sp. UNK]VFK68350.1 MAG: hypothetical protein BECKUNK1418H_GA0071006_100174 [Candidatus Kentron sp. UNK]
MKTKEEVKEEVEVEVIKWLNLSTSEESYGILLNLGDGYTFSLNDAGGKQQIAVFKGMVEAETAAILIRRRLIEMECY